MFKKSVMPSSIIAIAVVQTMKRSFKWKFRAVGYTFNSNLKVEATSDI